MTSKAITRDDLYQKVWSIPTSILASELGVSDVMIAKYCRKMDVPKPPLGYWARVYSGWKPTVPRLPRATEKTVLTLYYTPAEIDMPARDQEFEDQLIPPVFAERLESPHVLIAAVISWAEQATDLSRLALPKDEGYINLDVSCGQLDRALRIADALFKAFEANGYSVDVLNSNYWGERTRVGKEGCCAYFSISERYRKEKHEPEPGKKRKPPYLIVEPETFAPTGKLSVKVAHGYSDYKKWNDRQNDPLEYRLEEIVRYTSRTIEAGLQKKQADEELKRLRIETIERAESEEKCRDELLQDAKDWERAERLRRYLLALETAVRTDDPEHSAIIDEYVKWGMDFVNQLDPLNKINVIREQQDGEEEA